MAVTNFSPLLGLALPTTGDLSGTWGTTVNDSITSLIDSAVAGTTTLSANADVTLSTTNGASNQARNAVILWTASNGATTRYVTAPAQSKAYVVINAGTGSVVIRGSGPTSGVTVTSGTKALVAWNGSDFVSIAKSTISLTTDVTGTLPIANGGTGTTTPALVAGTNVTITGSWPNQTIAATGSGGGTPGGSTTQVQYNNAGSFGGITGATTNGTALTLVAPVLGTPASATLSNATGLPLTTGVTGTLPVANGGTGAATLTANNVVLGNGTSAVQFVAPGSSGNVLTSNGTTWASTASSTGGFSAMSVITSSGTFTIPTGKTVLKVTVIGAGGGGGGDTGAGGAGGTSSVASGTQTISTISATGGAGGGSGASTNSGGAGGSGSSGNINLVGSGGGSGSGGGGYVPAGVGGSSFLGGGAYSSGGYAAGSNGSNYGGGGSGGSRGGGSTSAGGGGGGGAAINYLTGLTPGNTLTITIGASGSSGSGAFAGGTGFTGVVMIEY